MTIEVVFSPRVVLYSNGCVASAIKDKVIVLDKTGFTGKVTETCEYLPTGYFARLAQLNAGSFAEIPS